MATFMEIRANRRKKKKRPRSTGSVARRNGRVADPAAPLQRKGVKNVRTDGG